MIIIINGPLGIGKTTVSWQLTERFPSAVLLDVDYIVALHPFDYYNQADLDYAYATIGLLVQHHTAHGIRHVVINWVFETPEQLARLQRTLPGEIPIHTFRLHCDVDELARRIRKRSAPEVEWELQRAFELTYLLQAAAQTGNLGTLIDTTNLSPEQIVDVIWSHLTMGDK